MLDITQVLDIKKTIETYTKVYNTETYAYEVMKWIQTNVNQDYELIDIGSGAGLMSLAISGIDNPPENTYMVDLLEVGRWDSDTIILNYNRIANKYHLNTFYNWFTDITKIRFHSNLQQIFIVDTDYNVPYYNFIIDNFKGSYIISDDAEPNLKIDKPVGKKTAAHYKYLTQKIEDGTLTLIQKIIIEDKPNIKYILRVNGSNSKIATTELLIKVKKQMETYGHIYNSIN